MSQRPSVGPDKEEIRRYIDLIFEPGRVMELRAPNSYRDGVISGYFSDPAKLASAAFSASGRAPGVYITLNPIRPDLDLLARANNRVKSRARETTVDADIVRRHLLLFDFDPKRPAGISSTLEEHDAALEAARFAAAGLTSRDWPAPVWADSGNGGHLIYRIDLPNDPESTDLVKRVLKAASQRYAAAGIDFDLTVFNASRISKVYGTVAQKGDSTEDRPHRLSRIISRPDLLEPVPLKLLEALAREAKNEQPRASSPRSGSPGPPTFSLEKFLSDFGIAIERGPDIHQGSERWILAHCPFNPAHVAPDAAVWRQIGTGTLGFKCLHASCAEKHWKEFREFYEPSSARRHGARPASPEGNGREEIPPSVAEAVSEPIPDLLRFDLNDHGNSQRIVAVSGADIRFFPDQKSWLVWDGRRWMRDEVGQIMRCAKLALIETGRQAIHAGNTALEKWSRSSLDYKRVRAALAMAESETYVRANDLDIDPYALNFTNGTVDLRTSILRAHSRRDFITKLVKHPYEPDARCPLWITFLAEVMGGGPDASEPALDRADGLVAFIQRALGYSVTGSTSAKAVFCPFGPGDNGKSTMLTVIRELLPEYSVLLQVDTLMVRTESNNTQADLADLRGARFVQTSETEEGQRLAQGKLKRITQGMGRIKAVRKYENPIEFPETHKLWLDTNRKPTIRDADDRATFNRLFPIPFEVTIPPDRIDRSLLQKLLSEAPGILAWLVKGARIWNERGLEPPKEIAAAKAQWRSEMDQLGRFIEEACLIDSSALASAAELYSHYRAWAERSGEHFVTSAAFGVKISDRHEKRRTAKGVYYVGLKTRQLGDTGDDLFRGAER